MSGGTTALGDEQLIDLSDAEFAQIQGLLRRQTGIHLSPAKKALVCGRLRKRLTHHGLDSYGAYFRLLQSGAQELQTALDLLTTNETYFFREPKHFDFLRDQILPTPRPRAGFRVWSAACSSGEEAYSLAMLLADRLGDAPWEILASDISTRVLERARSGHYPLERSSHIPEAYLKIWCLKGIGPQAGTFLVDRRLRARVAFERINLNETLPRIGEFDLILLRNAMIYFDQETKRQVIRRLVPALRAGGHLMIGHSESLNGIDHALRQVCPSIYRKE